MVSTMPLSMLSSWSRKAWSWSGEVISILASTSVFSISMAALSRAILAPVTFLGILGCSRSLSMTMPCTSSESVIPPPTFFSTVILSVSTEPSSSTTASTAWTARLASWSRAVPEPLPVMEVMAIFFRNSASFTETSVAMVFRISRDLSDAAL